MRWSPTPPSSFPKVRRTRDWWATLLIESSGGSRRTKASRRRWNLDIAGPRRLLSPLQQMGKFLTELARRRGNRLIVYIAGQVSFDPLWNEDESSRMSAAWVLSNYVPVDNVVTYHKGWKYRYNPKQSSFLSPTITSTNRPVFPHGE